MTVSSMEVFIDTYINKTDYKIRSRYKRQSVLSVYNKNKMSTCVSLSKAFTYPTP